MERNQDKNGNRGNERTEKKKNKAIENKKTENKNENKEIDTVKNEKTENKKFENEEINKKDSKMINKKDIIIMTIIILIYGIMSFINLGRFTNPQTYWKSSKINDEIIIELQEAKKISKIAYYTGNIEGKYKISFSTDKENYTDERFITPESVFHWYNENIESTEEYKYIKIEAKEKNIYLGEVGVYDQNGELIKVTSPSKNGQTITDEQDTIPEEISYLNSTYFDEIYFPRTAYEYLHGLDIYEWVHPPLGKLIIATSMAIFGATPFAFRVLGNIAGILMLPSIYILAKMLFKKSKYAATAAIIMALDGMHFVQTRIGTVDSFLVLFIMLEYLFMYKYIISKSKPLSKKLLYLFLSGLFMGLSIDVKWSGVFSALGLAIIFFASLIKEIKEKKKWTKQNTIIILCCIVFFIIIPAIIYVISFIPYYIGENPAITDIQSFFEYQKEMFNYHNNLKATHDYSSEWYTWPITQKSVFYWTGTTLDGKVSKIALLGNPIVFWISVPCMLFVLIRGLIKRKREDWFIIVAIIITMLPYLKITRIMFLYHYFPVLPFAILSIVAFFSFLCDKIKSNIPIYIFLLTVLVVFIKFYPIYSGLPVQNEYLENLKWLDTWIW